ncbi:MAG: hypothetical protein HY815_05175 [Candidatus Riflebacteria bacterium]|nr:hypothetical protein [Candidatus Riflebacteria bacterium]
MRGILQLELVKWSSGRRNLLYVLLPNLYPIAFTLFLIGTIFSRSQTVLALLGAGLATFLLVHQLNGFVMYPALLLLRCSETWAGEEAERTLRTLVLTQVPRWKILVAKVLMLTASFVLAHLVFFAIFIVDTLLIRWSVPPEIWAKIPIDVGNAVYCLVAYTAVFAVALAVFSLFFSWISLLASRLTTVVLLSMTILVAVWWVIPSLVEQVRPNTTIAKCVFTRPYGELISIDTLLPMIKKDASTGNLSTIARDLAANGVVLGLLCLVTLRRKEFLD